MSRPRPGGLSARWRGVLLAVAGAALTAFSQYHVAGIGECSTPPEDGLPPCPDQFLLYVATFAGGIGASVAAARRTNPSLGLAGPTLGYGAGSALAAAAGHAGPTATALGYGALGLGAVAVAFGVRGLLRAAADEDLMAGGGVFAEGTVLEAASTGALVDGRPVVRVRMRIVPFGMMAPFEGRQEVPLDRVPRPGERCAVWVRPGDQGRWIFRTAAAEGAPPVAPASDDVVVDLAALSAAVRAGRIGDAELARLAGLVLGAP